MKSKNLARALGTGLVVLAVFSFGVAVGDGRVGAGIGSNAHLPKDLDYASVNAMYDVLRQDYDGTLQNDDLVAGMKKGLAEAAGDPYTTYFTPEQAKEFNEQLNGSFSGIGAELGQDKDDNLIVVSPISGTPADRAGLKSQDIIAEVDGMTTSGMSIDEAVTKIRGPKGTEVKLTLIRNKTDTIPVTIVRDDINVPSVTSKMLDNNVGYLRISTFSDTAGTEAQKAAKDLKDAGAKKIVLDLRGNPGGRVDAAIDIASLWLPKGTMIMQEKRDDVVIKSHTATGTTVFEGLPTVVLINGGSASASEIVAGALLDNNAATLIGEKSYGKGSVQELKELSDGDLLKVTVARWYRPNGKNIDKEGIEPSRAVVPTADDLQAGRDMQLETAQAELNQ